MMQSLKAIAAASLGLCLSLSAFSQDVTGAGASFPAPLYSKWAAEYNKALGQKVNYQSVGSGAGIKQIDAKTVDFGASDMPLKDEDLAQKNQMQFPTVIGGVVPVVNIAGVTPGQLKLTGEVIADIFLGKITKWNDPAIKALNASLNLPDAAIAPVRRSDGSGTTFLFTNYLSKVNAEWKAKVGDGTAVNWPTGAGGKGNEGVAAFVGRLPNSIGYVEYAYVKQNKMTYTLMRNKDGQFVTPSDVSKGIHFWLAARATTASPGAAAADAPRPVALDSMAVMRRRIPGRSAEPPSPRRPRTTHRHCAAAMFSATQHRPARHLHRRV